MNIKKKIVLLTWVSVFLIVCNGCNIISPKRIVGISVGDWFKYSDIDVSWSTPELKVKAYVPMYEPLQVSKCEKCKMYGRTKELFSIRKIR